MTIADRLELSRKDLLDLTFRNPLLNYRPLRARGVEIVQAEPGRIFKHLVAEGKRLGFRALGRDAAQTGPPADPVAVVDIDFDAALDALESGAPTPTPALDTSRRGDASPLALATPSSPSDLFKRLLNTETAARTFVEEQGINALYLALGMLVWRDAATDQERRSPLVLVPVELERAAAGERYHLRHSGGEVGSNVSLAAALRSGITKTDFDLPELPEAVEDLDVAAYIDQVALVVGQTPGWRVERDAAALAFFSFAKMAMWADLDPAAWPETDPIAGHPLLQALLGDGFHEPDPRVAEDAHLDALMPPDTLRTIADADSSQLSAIEDVKQGRTLVIQGPPGTGKSQTITNLLAEAIGQGKTVLFVAEKLAALEVVKRRLDALGIGDACLELHSHKSRKRAVIDELRRTWELPAVRAVASDGATPLAESQRLLNDYSEALNAPVERSEVPLQHAIGEWLALRRTLADQALPQIALPGLTGWSAPEYQRREQFVRETQAHLARMGVPASHPFAQSRRTTYLPTQTDGIHQACSGALEAVRTLRGRCAALAEALALPPPETAPGAEALAHAVLRAIEAPDFEGLALRTGQWTSRRAEIEALLEAGSHLADLRERFAARLIPEAWDQDVLAARQGIAAHGDKWYRVLVGEWRAARRRLASLCPDGKAPAATATQLELLDAVLEHRRTRERFRPAEPLGALLFGAQWQGEASRWPVLRQLFAWIAATHEAVGDGSLPAAFLDVIQGNRGLAPLAEPARAVLEASRAAAAARDRALEEVVPADPDAFRARTLEAQEEALALWTAHTPRLQEMAAYNDLRERARELGLTPLLDAAGDAEGVCRNLVALLRLTWFGGLVDRALTRHPELRAFSGDQHAARIDAFRSRDAAWLRENRHRLVAAHRDRIARLKASGAGGQLGVLTRQFQLQRRHLPIRRLVREAGHAIQAIKPVFMMSPLSVASFLPPGALSFDLVVFDEASQVKPVDALGTLARGRQAVVVGDSKQLPPTSFFDKLAGEESVEDDNATGDLESVLGLFVAQQAPQRMLRWHYRSRHESLIAVSNQSFYDNGLVIFPSPDDARERLGLRYHHLPDTVYRGDGVNPQEARRVAEAVMEHAKAQVGLPAERRATLGVAAFSLAQATAIQLHLEALRRQNPACEPFFAAGGAEPFFVKNLENVQGDERDVVYLSVGYGRTAEGKVAMNFGPLNRQGGERRLNVIATRARLRCEIFTNLLPDDIDLSRTGAAGVVALKRFFDYARTGRLEAMATPSGREPDSPFEREVLRVLEDMGANPVPQVGCAGYFVDIALRDPARPGRFFLGIECDGATYHSARSARDRDRLREEVLVRMGWRLHRIWSTDWLYRRAEEVQRLRSAVDAALAQARLEEERVAAPEPVSAAPPPLEFDPAAAEPPKAKTGAAPYVPASVTPGAPVDVDAVETPDVAALVAHVVQVEGPVHVDDLARRLATAIGWQRVTERLRAGVRRGIAHAAARGHVVVRGDFVWRPGSDSAPPRDRRGYADRAIERIAPEEIAAAIDQAVRDACGMARGDVARAAADLLGFDRVTAKTTAPIEAIVDARLASGALRLSGTTVLPPTDG